MLKEYYEKKLQELENEKHKLQNEMIPYKRFSLFDKIFRKKYIKDTNRQHREKNRPIKDQIEKIDKEIEDIRVERDNRKIYSEKRIKDIFEFVKSGKIYYEFDENDTVISESTTGNYYKKEKEKPIFKSLEDFLLVHKTNFFPCNDTIYTAKSTHAKKTTRFSFRGKKYEADYLAANDSTHFGLNGPVTSHRYGNWDDRKYAIVVGLNDVNRENLLSVNFEDTYFEGNVHLEKKYYILVPKNEIEEIKKNKLKLNPNAIIVPYDGISLNDAVLSLVACLGKQPEEITNNGWLKEDSEVELNARKVLKSCKQGSKYEGVIHVESENMMQRVLEERANRIISIFELLKKEGLNPTLEELLELIENHGHKLLDDYKYTNETFVNYYIKVLKKNNYNISEDIINEERFQTEYIREHTTEYYNDVFRSKLAILDEYVCKALLEGKQEREKTDTSIERED